MGTIYEESWCDVLDLIDVWNRQMKSGNGHPLTPDAVGDINAWIGG